MVGVFRYLGETSEGQDECRFETWNPDLLLTIDMTLGNLSNSLQSLDNIQLAGETAAVYVSE